MARTSYATREMKGSLSCRGSRLSRTLIREATLPLQILRGEEAKMESLRKRAPDLADLGGGRVEFRRFRPTV